MSSVSVAMLSSSEFWSALADCGYEVTDDFTADGRSRFCRKPDGERCVISVHDSYPKYILDKILDDHHVGVIPLYNNRHV